MSTGCCARPKWRAIWAAMRIRAAIAAALLALAACGERAGPGQPRAETQRRPTVADDEAILRALLAYHAQSAARGRLDTCVTAELTAAEWTPDRSTIQAGPEARWLPIPYDGAPLPIELKRRLGEAAARALRQSEQARIRRIEPAWIPAPLRLGEFRRPCEYALSFAPPLVQGDYAFVQDASNCGPECGSGELYALRREGSGWRLVAALPLWIS